MTSLAPPVKLEDSIIFPDKVECIADEVAPFAFEIFVVSDLAKAGVDVSDVFNSFWILI